MSEGFKVAMNWGNSQGAKEPSCFVIPLAMMGGTGNLHAPFDVAGDGTQLTVRLVRHSQRKRGATDRSDLRSMASALDPTDERGVETEARRS